MTNKYYPGLSKRYPSISPKSRLHIQVPTFQKTQIWHNLNIWHRLYENEKRNVTIYYKFLGFLKHTRPKKCL